MKLQLLGALIGNVLEWYDYGIFGALTEPIGQCFFPASSEAATLLSTLGVFTSGFVARPVGGALFGWLGDRYGRKPALLISVVLMAAATFGIGILPCYSTWGIVSPVLLLFLRIAEGLSVGGELIGGILLLVESAPTYKQRGLYGSAAMATSGLGIALGFLTVGVLQLAFSNSSAYAWSHWIWRIPFLIGLLVAGFALWVRKFLEESPEFLQRIGELREDKPSNPLLLAITNYKLAMLITFGVVILGSFCVWVGFFLPNYVLYRIPEDLRSPYPMLVYLLILIYPFLTLYWGHLADHWGALRCMCFSAVGIFFLSGLVFYLAASGSIFGTLLSFFIFGTLVSAYVGPICVWLTEAFAVEVRYSAVALAYNLAQALLGGSSQLIIGALLVYYPQHYILYPAITTSTVAFISFIALICSHFFMSKAQNFADGFCNIQEKPAHAIPLAKPLDDDLPLNDTEDEVCEVDLSLPPNSPDTLLTRQEIS